MRNIEENKTCTNCNKEYPATEEFFYRQKVTKKDGTYYKLTARCIDCSKLKSRNYIENNRSRKAEYQKKYYQEKAEYHKEYSRKRKSQRREYYRENSKQWRKNNPEKLKEYNRQHRNHDISKSEWEDCKIYFNNECCYCGLPLDEHKETYKQDLHKDHFDPNGENDLSNCVPACRICNIRKRDYPPEKFIEENHIELEKIYKINKWLCEDYKQYLKKVD